MSYIKVFFLGLPFAVLLLPVIAVGWICGFLWGVVQFRFKEGMQARSRLVKWLLR